MQREGLRFSSTAKHLRTTGCEENKAHQRGHFVRQRAYHDGRKRTVRRIDGQRENEVNMLMVESDKGLNFLDRHSGTRGVPATVRRKWQSNKCQRDYNIACWSRGDHD
ncbi:hypothetical protein Ciccas_007708 [Cichlidogyrus casuarinus]|uniref:Uncharacterized protein n=1 Tax=Cichlidogyrus casuarinus TaxID=1844966 RepID=A0ABD2Q390_9PLAT